MTKKMCKGRHVGIAYYPSITHVALVELQSRQVPLHIRDLQGPKFYPPN